MKDLAIRSPVSIAVALNATSPIPSGGAGAVIWSTITGTLLTWNGSAWVYPGVPRVLEARSFSAGSIPFDSHCRLAATTVSSNLTLIPSTANAIVGGSAYVRLIGNGTNTISFDAAFKRVGGTDFDQTTGKVNVVWFWYDGTAYCYTLAQEGSGNFAGDVTGPGSSTDNRVARMLGTTGKAIDEAPVAIDDSGNITGVGNITLTGMVDGVDVSALGTTVSSHTGNTSNPHSTTAAQVGAAPAELGGNAQTGTTYTLALTDKNALVRCTNAAAITVTIPPNSSVAFPVGSVVAIGQGGAGQVTVSPGAGVTLRTPRGAKTALQYSVLSASKVATDEWWIGGDVTT